FNTQKNRLGNSSAQRLTRAGLADVDLLHRHHQEAPRHPRALLVDQGEQVLARLQRFLLRVDVALTLIPADAATPNDVEHSRVAQGWPRGGHEIIAGETIPAELPMLAELVSFTKGCYPGQELVERMDARQSSSPFEIIRMAGDLDVGAEVIVDDVAVGVVTSSDGGAMLVRARRRRDS
ncbi:MAG: hypothetical protein ACO3M1_07750, partial [Ilumatobacteraceae bacterium]